MGDCTPIIQVNVTMHTYLVSWSRGLYLAGIVLALVAVVPTEWFPFALAKVAVFSVLLFVCAVCLVAGGGVRDLLRAHGFWGALLVALLPVAYLVSAWLSFDRSLAFSGLSIETDTVVFVCLAFAAFVLAFVLFRTLRTVRMLLSVLFWTLVAAVVFQCVSVVLGGVPGIAAFADASANLVGKWNDLGLLAGLLLLLVLVRLELTALAPLSRIGLGLLGVVTVLLLGLINFPLAWGTVLAGALVVGAVRFVTSRGDRSSPEEAPSPRDLPWFSVAGAVVAMLFVLFGTNLNARLAGVFPVSSLEVRPSYSSSMDMVSAGQEGSLRKLLVGSGPGTFGPTWLKEKPAEVNQSAFWNLDFKVGFSTLTTALLSVGLLGVVGWLTPLFLVLASVVRALRARVLGREDRVAATSLALGSVALFAALLFYVPSGNIVLLAFVLCGATFGFLWRQGQSRSEEAEPSRLYSAATLVCAVVILVLVGTTGFVAARRAVAQSYIGLGTRALQQSDADGALAAAASALRVEKNADALRLKLEAGGTKLVAIAQTEGPNVADLQKQFTTVLQETLTTGAEAQAAAPGDYRASLLLGRIYAFLASLKIEGAYQNAKTSYAAAAERSPKNPEIPLLVARLEAAQGDGAATEAALERALTLKPNYTDAILFVAQLAVQNNDLPTAVRAAQAAAQSAPGVPSIWFELGLLLYSGGDTASAVPALEQAVALVPDYANAKYFLGLSYYVQGKTPEAVGQFEDLERTNPEHAEVKLILANMRAGRPAFEGAVPPAATPPQQRDTAPLP